MAKILLTSVGTGNIEKDSDGNYILTKYILDGQEYEDTLTSRVIAKHYGIEKIYFIGTKKSMWDNFYLQYGGGDENYFESLVSKKNDGTLKETDLKELEKLLDTYLGYRGSRCFIIDYEKNDMSEIWGNFMHLLTLRNELSQNDSVVIDITHGFRYMPILNLFLVETIRAMQNGGFSIKAVLYGMFAGNTSQIIDFKIFFDLLDWIKAIDSFKKGMDAGRLSTLLVRENFTESAKVFEQLGKNLQLANIHALWKFTRGITKK